jgi:hypothetical protein
MRAEEREKEKAREAWRRGEWKDRRKKRNRRGKWKWRRRRKGVRHHADDEEGGASERASGGERERECVCVCVGCVSVRVCM